MNRTARLILENSTYGRTKPQPNKVDNKVGCDPKCPLAVYRDSGMKCCAEWTNNNRISRSGDQV